MPIGVLNRIILASITPRLVLDPSMAGGTTSSPPPLAARKYVGIDQSEDYVGFARKHWPTRWNMRRAVTRRRGTDPSDWKRPSPRVSNPRRESK